MIFKLINRRQVLTCWLNGFLYKKAKRSTLNQANHGDPEVERHVIPKMSFSEEKKNDIKIKEIGWV